MIENEFVKKITNKILKNRKLAFFDRDIMHPEREWFLGIFVAIVILGAGTFWSTKTYVQFSNILLTNEDEEENVVYRASMVEAALVDFAARKKVYQELKAQLVNKYPKQETSVPVPETNVPSAPEEVIEVNPEVVPEVEAIDTTEGIRFE